MPAEFVENHGEASLALPMVWLALTERAGMLEVTQRIVREPGPRVSRLNIWEEAPEVVVGGNGPGILSRVIKRLTQMAMTDRIERIRHDRTLGSRNPRLVMSHPYCKTTLLLQEHRVVRHKFRRSIVHVAGLGKIQ